MVSSGTWRVVQHSEIRLFLRQNAEHHVPGRFPAAVQDPGREGPERAQRADVDDDARQTGAPRHRAQNSRRQTERRAHVQRQVRVHLVHIREVPAVPRHVPERSCGHMTRDEAIYSTEEQITVCSIRTMAEKSYLI